MSSKRVGIGIKPGSAEAPGVVEELSVWLQERGHSCVMASSSADLFSPRLDVVSIEHIAEEVDLMVVLGGDGSLLHTARYFAGAEAPIFGVNLGNLGFLTGAAREDIYSSMDTLLAGKGSVEELYSFHVDLFRGDKEISRELAINDIYLHRAEFPRMISFEMQVAEEFVFALRGDGIILATPAGSTGYALSAGGPIVHPTVRALSVVPISPHTLSNRPIVIPMEETVELTVTESNARVALSIDGQFRPSLQQGDAVRISLGDSVRFVYPKKRNYYSVLRSKLQWGGPISPS